MSKTKNKVMHIAVAGNIGSGKTTLANMLSKHYGWEIQLEDNDDNPYISDFYEDMQRWSFNLQVYFLNVRYKNIKKIRENGKPVIQDRTIYEDANIFAPNLHAMGLMSTRDFENYTSLFTSLNDMIRPPDLLIYLRGTIPTLVKQIQQRGRDYEDSIRLDYLKRLNERYEAWISTYNLGKILAVLNEKGTQTIVVQTKNDLHFLNNQGVESKSIYVPFSELDYVSIFKDPDGTSFVSVIDGLENNVFIYSLNGELINKESFDGSQEANLTWYNNKEMIITTVVDGYIVQYVGGVK